MGARLSPRTVGHNVWTIEPCRLRDPDLTPLDVRPTHRAANPIANGDGKNRDFCRNARSSAGPASSGTLNRSTSMR